MTTIPLYTGLARSAALRGFALMRLSREYPSEAKLWRDSAAKAFRAARVIGGVR
jgi:hypothetical protein